MKWLKRVNQYVVRRGAKQTLILGIAFLLGMPLTACKGLENTEIILTTGLSGNQLFKVGTSLCTLPEAFVYVDAYAEQYETVYGVEMWGHDFGGVTLEEYVKNNIISQLATIKAMTLLAEQYEVVLDKVDEEQVEKAAEEYINSLGEEEREWINITKEEAVRLYRDHLLANRVYREITADVNTEVSDDEARIITVQQIFIPVVKETEGGMVPYTEEEKQEAYERAQEAVTQLTEGKEFLTVASVYNQSEQLTYSFGRGEMDPVYEEAAFLLDKDQVSDIVETDQGYYILKCTENLNREATDQNKEKLVAARRDEKFQLVYEELIANTPSEFHTKLWEGVRMDNPSLQNTGVTFFSIYNDYFG